MTLKELTQYLAVAYLLSMSIVMTVIFNIAVLNDGHTLVSVNKYGEMVPELLGLQLVMWPTISVVLAYWLFERPNA